MSVRFLSAKDGHFKQESFLDEAKVFYTDLINQMVLDDKDRLSIFDKNGLYLATKKVGKNNPKAEEIKADNEIRMEWNRAIALLERLIAKIMQKVMDVAEKIIGKTVDDEKETPEKTERHIHAKDEPLVRPERPPQPKPSVLVGKYPRLKEIDSRLKDQNKVIFGREKKRDLLKEELSECTGIFKGGRRKKLQQEIDEIDIQISNIISGFHLS